MVQSYIGSYGAMIHPIAACATAAVSVEEGVDKIRLGKAELVVAGGIDDLTLEGIIGFGDMAATADSEMMRRTASTTGSVRRHGNKSGWGSIWFPSSTSPRKSTGPRGIRGDPYAGTAQGNIVAALAHWNCSLDAQRLPGHWVIVSSKSETRKHNRSAQPRQRGPRVSVKETRRQLRLAQRLSTSSRRWLNRAGSRCGGGVDSQTRGGLHRQ